MFKAIILALAVVSSIQLVQGVDLANFEKAFAHVTNGTNLIEKISGLEDLVNIMQENDHLYSNEMLKVTFLLKKLTEEAQNDAEITKLEEIKQILPASLQNMTCPKVKFYQPDIRGYLYADLKLMHTQERRYAFADGKFDDLTTTWILQQSNDFLYIINDFLDETLYTKDDNNNRLGITHTRVLPGTMIQQRWTIELVYGTNDIRLRSIQHNLYLHVTDDFIQDKRILRSAENPKNSHWQIHCA